MPIRFAARFIKSPHCKGKTITIHWATCAEAKGAVVRAKKRGTKVKYLGKVNVKW